MDNQQPAYHSLGSIAARGYTHLRFCCLGCGSLRWVPLDFVISRAGPAVGLLHLAQRSVCRRCGRKGAHVELAEPPTATNGPGYLAWLERRMHWILREGSQIQNLIKGGVEVLGEQPVTQYVEWWRS